MTVCERLFRQFKFELPGTPVTELMVDGDLVSDPDTSLSEVLEKAGSVQDSRLMGEVSAFRRKFEEEHGCRLLFESGAINRLGELAGEQGRSVLQLCEELFRDYKFGLNMIRQNTGQQSFTIPEEGIEDPDKFLRGLVVASYQDGEETSEAGDTA